MRFRDDVNGLRALAVVAVVLFHFKPSLLPAGFAGVDVFFVISGYLMTGAIFPKVEAAAFSLAGFYWGRAKRLIPALLALAAVLLIWGYFNLLPLEYKQLGEHAASALVFASNLVLYSESGYFDSSSHLKWLLHTWSLSVEWQFYLIYPLIIMAVVRTMGAKAGRWSIVLMMGLSFVFATWASYRFESFAYYMLPARAWEMLIGGVVYLYPIELKGLKKVATALAGLMLIIGSLLALDSHTPWPGQWALLPVLGTCLVIAAGVTGSRLARNGLVAWLGKTSYSTYLWHWPICVYLYSNGLAELPLAVALGVGCSFVLGLVSYLTVENIGTQRRHPRAVVNGRQAKARRPAAIVAFCMVLCAGMGVVNSNGAAYRVKGDIKALSEITNVYEHFDFKKNIRYGECHSVPREVGFAQCIERRGKMLFIWGDSYAAALYQGLLNARDQYYTDYGIAQMTDGNGPPFFSVPGKTDEGKPVQQANNDRLDAVAINKPDVVVMTWLVFGSNAPQKAQTLAMLQQTVNRIKGVSPLTKVVVVGPVPHWNGNLSSMVLDYWAKNKTLPPAYMTHGLNPDVAAWDDYLKHSVPTIGATYVSAYDIFCGADGCLSRLGDDAADLPFVDFGHLTKNGSIYLLDKIQREVFR